MRVGLIGAGWVGTHRHLPAFRRMDNVTIVGIFDRNLERAVAAADGIENCFATDDLGELLRARLDAVSICTPPWSHSELAIEALAQGHHVLTEKPMAMDTDEAGRMVAAANRAERLLCVSHNFLFSHAVQRADKLLRGQLPHYVLGMQMSSDYRRLPTWYQELPGGLLFDELPHFMYLMDHFLGGVRFEGVRAVRTPQTKHPTTVEIQLSGEHGEAQIVVLSRSPVSEWHMNLVGADQVIGLDLFRDIAVRVPSDGEHGALDILKSSVHAISGHVAGFVTSGTRLATRQMFWGHDGLIRRFVDSVETGVPPPVTLEQATRVVGVTDRVIESL